MGPIRLIKLGGSLITDKRGERQLRAEVIDRLAAEIAELRREQGGDWLVGHGSGSFGHVEAHRHRVHEGVSSAEQLPGVAATADEAARLHRRVIAALRAAGESPWSFAPSSAMVSVGGKPAELAIEPLRRAIDLGLLPVAYGDVVMDRERGCAICSTETLFLTLVAALQERGRIVERVFWLGETDGIYDPNGATIPEIVQVERDDVLAGSLEGAAGTDVTGGIRHRLETALALAGRGVTSWVGDGRVPGALARAAAGEATDGTWIRPKE